MLNASGEPSLIVLEKASSQVFSLFFRPLDFRKNAPLPQWQGGVVVFGRTEPELKVRAERLSPEDDSLNEERIGRLGDAEDFEIVFDVGNAGDAEVLDEHIDHTGRKEAG